MNLHGNVTVCARPSLGAAGRWSVDYWQDGHPQAAYQAGLVTYDSAEQARQAAFQFKTYLEPRGCQVSVIEQATNGSQDSIPKPRESEDEIKKHLQSYIEKFSAPMRTTTIASFFEIQNWAKSVKALANKSTVLFSLLALAFLIFRGPLNRLIEAVIPNEFALKMPQLLEYAPMLLLLTTLGIHFRSQRESTQLNRVRVWVLQLAVYFGWDYYQFQDLLTKEFQQLDYASFADRFSDLEKRNPASFTNVLNEVAKRLEGSPGEKTDQFLKTLIRDDFARKIQALAGLGAEPEFKARNLALMPLHLILSNSAVKTIMLGFLGATPDRSYGPAGVEPSRVAQEKAALQAVKMGLIMIFVVVVPTLAWTTVLALKVSPLLFAADCVASLLTLAVVAKRASMIVFRRQLAVGGLDLHECAGAMKLDVA
ncbi:MAG: hypothetical protein WBQ94_00465 [Terracidiphilus sp.]